VILLKQTPISSEFHNFCMVGIERSNTALALNPTQVKLLMNLFLRNSTLTAVLV
jgi:hypothetical protein